MRPRCANYITDVVTDVAQPVFAKTFVQIVGGLPHVSDELVSLGRTSLPWTRYAPIGLGDSEKHLRRVTEHIKRILSSSRHIGHDCTYSDPIQPTESGGLRMRLSNSLTGQSRRE